MKQMDAVSRTLYIPLYGRAMLSRQGLILEDRTAERIWSEAGFALRGKSRSRFLAYDMAMRARVFDDWTARQLAAHPDALVLHIGCGLCSRALRVKAQRGLWVDIDLPAVMAQRRRYYEESDTYRMLAADVRSADLAGLLPEAGYVVIVMEGLSMYLTQAQLLALLETCARRYPSGALLMDCYTPLGAKISRWKNPVRDVGAQIVSGVDEPRVAEQVHSIRFAGELEMTPRELIALLPSPDRQIFGALIGGKTAKAFYRLYEYAIGGDRDEGKA